MRAPHVGCYERIIPGYPSRRSRRGDEADAGKRRPTPEVMNAQLSPRRRRARVPAQGSTRGKKRPDWTVAPCVGAATPGALSGRHRFI